MASLLKIYQAGTLFGAALPNITQCCLLNAVFGLSVPWFQLISLNYHLHPNHWFCGIVGPLMRNSSLVCAWQLVISVCSRFVIMQ
ncbi:uncharacterized protein ASPGLDRAFT_50713 [Aspergillus glaucus CBS 516.65]|uniref:Uncharacterized protein n=1 Tax=Aspergillus glaucus CBS 516.65 TaxID=1160497 RepID=A0A1L9VBG2_ASPGL|nr:hypothetical protein ASPGLDRAFT_50713 [Aspergillus glaucus CBS 516.65]OJJ81182.1 hypothetical protein ASPGLDRAFT_50713 [Aspergillus glaucus CBS 516.65]